ncbi:hypothetical protein HMPREF1583_00520 [Gardnerella vaginalis JCP8151B]|nr:hypothetical protein HMPREF1583_00520 [Gardnerella vaginalis JCP8151B]
MFVFQQFWFRLLLVCKLLLVLDCFRFGLKPNRFCVLGYKKDP